MFCDDCYPFQDEAPYLLIASLADSCKDGDVRLNGFSEFEGVVEVCLQQRWGSVCSDGWSVADANVTCQQLGYSSDDGIGFFLLRGTCMHMYNSVALILCVCLHSYAIFIYNSTCVWCTTHKTYWVLWTRDWALGVQLQSSI